LSRREATPRGIEGRCKPGGLRAKEQRGTRVIYSYDWRMRLDEFIIEPVDHRAQARARSTGRRLKRKCYFFLFFL
jgi:hypothetical protein